MKYDLLREINKIVRELGKVSIFVDSYQEAGMLADLEKIREIKSGIVESSDKMITYINKISDMTESENISCSPLLVELQNSVKKLDYKLAREKDVSVDQMNATRGFTIIVEILGNIAQLGNFIENNLK